MWRIGVLVELERSLFSGRTPRRREGAQHRDARFGRKPSFMFDQIKHVLKTTVEGEGFRHVADLPSFGRTSLTSDIRRCWAC